MGEIVCRQYYFMDEVYRTVTLPGPKIANIPVFGKTSASFTPGSPSTASIKDSIYTYSDKIRKGTPSSYTTPYITAVSAPFIDCAYDNSTHIYSGSSELLCRNKVYVIWGFITGKGGNGGNGKQNWASWDRGSGGGGAGAAIFWMVSRSPITVSYHNNNEIGFYLWEYIRISVTNGGDGGAKYTPGGGGSASVGTSNNTYKSVGEGGRAYWVQDTPYRARIGVYLCGGQRGGDGKGWNEQTEPGDYTLTLPAELKNFLGISDNVSWTRNDGQGGASVAPGVNENGGTTWYGSGGHSGSGGNGGRTDGQPAGARWWSYEINA